MQNMTITTHYSHQSQNLSLRGTWDDLMIYFRVFFFHECSYKSHIVSGKHWFCYSGKGSLLFWTGWVLLCYCVDLTLCERIKSCEYNYFLFKSQSLKCRLCLVPDNFSLFDILKLIFLFSILLYYSQSSNNSSICALFSVGCGGLVAQWV